MHPNMIEVNDTHCRKCGGEWASLGSYPFCKGSQSDHGTDSTTNLLEPFHETVDEHILPNGRDFGLNAYGEKVWGTKISSRDQRDAIMREHHLHRDKDSRARSRRPDSGMGKVAERIHSDIMQQIRDGRRG